MERFLRLGGQISSAHLERQTGMKPSVGFAGGKHLAEDFYPAKALNPKISFSSSDGKSDSGFSCSDTSIGNLFNETNSGGDLADGFSFYGSHFKGCESLIGAFLKF